MGNLFNAHIFKRRSVGAREEVQLKVFGQDGEPIDLSAIGGGGGGGGSETSPVILDLEFLRDPINDGPVASDSSAPVAIHNVRRRYGIPLDVGDTEFELPAGIYLIWFDGQISTYNAGATPADGAWSVKDATDADKFYFDNPVEPVTNGIMAIQPQPFQSSGGPLHIALNNDYSIATDGGISGQVRVIIVSVGLYF